MFLFLFFHFFFFFPFFPNFLLFGAIVSYVPFLVIIESSKKPLLHLLLALEYDSNLTFTRVSIFLQCSLDHASFEILQHSPMMMMVMNMMMKRMMIRFSSFIPIGLQMKPLSFALPLLLLSIYMFRFMQLQLLRRGILECTP